jgi:trans-aconitate 2-methyltransferase
MTWNPDLYLKFGDERTRPAIDLVGRIDSDPMTILDVGCGPGNSTRVLLRRWPGSRIVGIDSSQEMIVKAREDIPELDWILADASTFETEDRFDLIFSNAVIQWIPDHASLFERFFGLLSEKGVIAVQVPIYGEMPLSHAIDTVSKMDPWKDRMKGCSDSFTLNDPGFYYDMLSEKMHLDMWQTDYYHVMPSHGSILDWIRSTGLRPYLDRIREEERPAFEGEVLERMKNLYPEQKDGSILFQFKRLFFVGYK